MSDNKSNSDNIWIIQLILTILLFGAFKNILFLLLLFLFLFVAFYYRKNKEEDLATFLVKIFCTFGSKPFFALLCVLIIFVGFILFILNKW